MRRKKADKSRGQGSGRDAGLGWGGGSRQLVRFPIKLWQERAFPHKWRGPAQVLAARCQGAERGCAVSHAWWTPGPYCSKSPALPLHAQERGVQVADAELRLGATGCRIK